MENEPILITMARTMDREQIDYRVLVEGPSSGKSSTSSTELASIELNRRICFPDGQVHTIVHHGGLFSIDSELHVATTASRDQPTSWRAKEPPLAMFHRERTSLLGHRNVLILSTEPERRYLLRRRSWFGSPANVDVVALSLGIPSQAEPILLRAEKSGTWRQRLLARWMAPNELPVPIMLYVLNVLADLDRRAAVAQSAGAAGL